MEFLETTIYKVIRRTYFYLKETGRENSFDRFPYLNILTQCLTQDAAETWPEGGVISSARYHRLLEKLTLESEAPAVLRTALDLSLAALHVPEFVGYLNYYTGNAVTIQLACDLEGITYPAYAAMARCLQKLQYVCRVDWSKNPLSHAAIEADNRLLAYLTGSDDLTPPLCRKAEWFLREQKLHPLFTWCELKEKCVRLLTQKKDKSPILQIAGTGGRRFLAKHTARSLNRNLLLTDAGHFRDCFGDNDGSFPMELIREAFLHDGAVCIYGIESDLFDKLQIKTEDFYRTVVLPFRETRIPLILCTQRDLLFPERIPCAVLPEATQPEREAVFRGFAGLFGFPADCTDLAARFRLSPSQIAEASLTWQSGHSLTKVWDKKAFSRICCEILCREQPGNSGTLLYPSVCPSDLKVPQNIQNLLQQICCSVTKSGQIFEEWGLKRLYPYGRGTSVLLTGPPGTGKTMTAHVIAKELDLPLYQVNLANVADKYIGETEKHLEQIFSFAEKANVVLFFDEADSLFGKRAEVTEGKDRYANMEVSYILQRMEQSDGIVILATNFYHNIDKAFLRRLKYVLKYQMPDEALRRSIWESCLPPTVPHEKLDIPYLARQFEFTGGLIKNVVWNACVKAVCAKTGLSMEHLLTAISEEYEKMEQTVGKNVWGEYGYLMP